MKSIIPKKLQKGDLIQVVAPARSLALISQETRKIANRRLEQLGMRLTFSEHVEEKDAFISSSIESRVSDIHAAFLNPEVKAILTVIGGFNSNQLLNYIDWNIIKSNPKIFCGYSDITVLHNAIFAKTGLVTYSGPHYSSFGQELHFDYTLNSFIDCLMKEDVVDIRPSDKWSDDAWYIDQNKRNLIPNTGYWIINPGSVQGTLIGGNIGTFNLVRDTEYMPSLENSILFIEDDVETLPHHFDRDLQSLIHSPQFHKVKALVIGRFQLKSNMSREILELIIGSKKELKHLPIVANVDFGHTDPKLTFPVGGEVALKADQNTCEIGLLTH